MLYNLFPGRDIHLQDAAVILSRIVAKEKSEGKKFHPGKFFISVMYHSNSSSCIDYKQNRDMNIVVSKIFLISILWLRLCFSGLQRGCNI